jgi:hypothetical protein
MLTASPDITYKTYEYRNSRVIAPATPEGRVLASLVIAGSMANGTEAKPYIFTQDIDELTEGQRRHLARRGWCVAD